MYLSGNFMILPICRYNENNDSINSKKTFLKKHSGNYEKMNREIKNDLWKIKYII